MYVQKFNCKYKVSDINQQLQCMCSFTVVWKNHMSIEYVWLLRPNHLGTAPSIKMCK